MTLNTKRCLICRPKNNTLYWHESEDDGEIWCYCNKCDRAYNIRTYCLHAGLSLAEFLKNDFDFEEARPNEVQKMAWPKNFLPLYDKRSQKGVEYIKSRGLELDDGMFYDIDRNGIVFAYYYDNIFCGAQIRLIEPWIDENGDVRKIDTIPGTRIGLLTFGWNQMPFRTNVKAVVVCEGAFNSFSIQQSLYKIYGGVLNSPFKVIALSGSGVSQHHLELLKELKEQGFRIIAALDSDQAGLKGLKKLITADAITHYALSEDTEKDWNDWLLDLGKDEFAKYFLRSIKPHDKEV